MATIEELLGLSKEGWKDIALMDEAKLNEYLKDITNLEHKSRIVNVEGSNEKEEEIEETKEESTNNPFTKAKNKKTKRKILSTYNIDLEAKELEKELGEL